MCEAGLQLTGARNLLCCNGFGRFQRYSAMNWVRTNLRQGALLALVALAINLALTFGHIHVAVTDGKAAVGILAAGGSSGHDSGQTSKGHGDQDELCPICTAIATMGTALAGSTPALSFAFACIALVRNFAAEFVVPRPQHNGFQSRGPPLLPTSLT